MIQIPDHPVIRACERTGYPSDIYIIEDDDDYLDEEDDQIEPEEDEGDLPEGR